MHMRNKFALVLLYVCLNAVLVIGWRLPTQSRFYARTVAPSCGDSQKLKSTRFNNIPHFVAHDGLYKDIGIDSVSRLSANLPVLKALEIMFNPVALVFLMYFVLVGYNQMAVFLKNIVSTFLFWKFPVEAAEPATESAFQVYQCDVCEMQLRPAKGRAEKILSRDRFRCARCGARASSYFDIEDMSDKRAVSRLKRLEDAQIEQDLLDDENGNSDYPDNIL